MRSLAPLALAALLLPAGAATSATQVPLFAGFDDADFQALCASGGGGNQGCEQAVVQIRGGDLGGAAQSELIVQDIVLNPGTGVAGPVVSQQSNFAFAAGTPYAFTVSFAPGAGGGLGTIGFSFAEGRPSQVTLGGAEDLLGLTTLFIRARQETTGPNARGSIRLSDLVVDGVALPDLQGGEGTGNYLAVAGLDTSQPFAITGTATLDGLTGGAPGSRIIGEFKFTDVSAPPIPLPAGAVLLLTGLGAFAVARRRRAAA